MQTAPADTPSDFATAAALERTRIVADCESHTWQQLPLQPWSLERQSAFIRILALDIPGHDLDDLPRIRARFDQLEAAEPSGTPFESCVPWPLYLPTAAKVLYLAAHAFEDWFHIRSKPVALLQTIDAWATAHIPPDQAPAACLLAQRILSEHRALIPMLKVAGGGNHTAQAGN